MWRERSNGNKTIVSRLTMTAAAWELMRKVFEYLKEYKYRSIKYKNRCNVEILSEKIIINNN